MCDCMACLTPRQTLPTSQNKEDAAAQVKAVDTFPPEAEKRAASLRAYPVEPLQRRSSSTHRGRDLGVTPLTDADRTTSPNRLVTAMRDRSNSRGRDYIQLQERSGSYSRGRAQSRGRDVDKTHAD
jgi:hypothetical protein